MMCEMEQEKLSQKPILMECSQGSTSHVSKAANLPDSLDKTEEQETDDTDMQNIDIADIEFDINQKLQKLNSLFKTKSAKGVAGKQKMPTTVMKGQKGHHMCANQSKQNQTTPSGLNFTRTVQVGNKTVQTSTVSTIPTGLESNRNNNATELVPAPLGRRRSDRLVDKSLEASTQGAPGPQSSVVPRQTTNDTSQVINLINAPPLVLPGVVSIA